MGKELTEMALDAFAALCAACALALFWGAGFFHAFFAALILTKIYRLLICYEIEAFLRRTVVAGLYVTGVFIFLVSFRVAVWFAPVTAEGNRLHVVEKGDTVYSLSRKYRVSPHAIQRWNGLDEAYTIRQGQKLVIAKR